MDWITLGFLDGLGTVGTWAVLGFCLIFDKGLALKSAVTHRDETILWLRASNEAKDETILNLTTGVRASTNAFEKVAQAAVIVAEGGEGT